MAESETNDYLATVNLIVGDYWGAFVSDLSRFHGLRLKEVENLTGEELFNLAYHAPAYDGAVAWAIRRDQEERKKYQPGLRRAETQAKGQPVQEVDAASALAMIGTGD